MEQQGDRPAPPWIESGAHPVAEGVWRIPLPLPTDGLRAVNVYAVADDDGFTLVDSGWALDVARRDLMAALAELGAGLGDIKQFLVTHMHRDHFTQAIAIRREFGTRVLLGERERRAIERHAEMRESGVSTFWDVLDRHGASELAAVLRAGGPPSVDPNVESPDTWIVSGDRFKVGNRVLEAIETPGHTRGHVVFADHDNGLLFAGDHVLPHITPSVGFEPEPKGLPLRDYLGSLRLVRALPDMTLLPAHGPAGDRVHARVDQLLDHHAVRLKDMAAVLATGPQTAFQVASQIGWTSRKRRFADLDPFNQQLAVLETALHLDLLVAQEEATATDREGVRFYSAGIQPPVGS